MPALPWRARIAVGTIFFANGAAMASWVPHVPAVQMGLGLRPSVLGLALLAMACGALIGIPLSGWCSARAGSRIVVHATVAAFFLALPLPLVAASLPALVATLFALGAANGALDVSMNTQAVAVERHWSGPILSAFHGLWSLGGFVGAGIASLALHAGIAPGTHLVVAAVVLAVLALVACRGMLRDDGDACDDAPHFARPTRELAVLGGVAFLGLMTEGAVGDWGAIYIRRTLGADAATGALGFAAFSGTMATGRFLGDRLVARLGDARLVRTATAFGAVGFGLALLAGTPVAAIAGCAAVGLGIANLVPVVFRAAGNVPGVAPSQGIAAVGTAGYAGFLAGPPLIGLAAEATSLAAALWILVGSLVWIALAAARLMTSAGDDVPSPALSASPPPSRPSPSG